MGKARRGLPLKRAACRFSTCGRHHRLPCRLPPTTRFGAARGATTAGGLWHSRVKPAWGLPALLPRIPAHSPGTRRFLWQRGWQRACLVCTAADYSDMPGEHCCGIPLLQRRISSLLNATCRTMPFLLSTLDTPHMLRREHCGLTAAVASWRSAAYLPKAAGLHFCAAEPRKHGRHCVLGWPYLSPPPFAAAENTRFSGGR